MPATGRLRARVRAGVYSLRSRTSRLAGERVVLSGGRRLAPGRISRQGATLVADIGKGLALDELFLDVKRPAPAWLPNAQSRGAVAWAPEPVTALVVNAVGLMVLPEVMSSGGLRRVSPTAAGRHFAVA
ncbi:hypothetical protein ACWDLG_06025 [Nonomuraea sp. NPDC003727]